MKKIIWCLILIFLMFPLTACLRIPIPPYGTWHSEAENITFFIHPELRLRQHPGPPRFPGIHMRDGEEIDVVVRFGGAVDGYRVIWISENVILEDRLSTGDNIIAGDYRIENGRLYITQYLGNPKASDVETLAIFELVEEVVPSR